MLEFLFDWGWIAPTYAGMGLVTARFVRHRMEDQLDARNEAADPASKHSQCYSVRYSSRNMWWCEDHHHTVGKDKTMQQHYGGSAWGIPAWVGGLWALAIPALGVKRVAEIVGKGISPGWSWFWENPKHRKAKKRITPGNSAPETVVEATIEDDDHLVVRTRW